jgi:DNA-binding response OmpR family regulator
VTRTHEHDEHLYVELRPSKFGKLRVLSIDGVQLDIDGMVLWVDGRRVAVTAHEFILLEMLMDSAGRVLGRDELLDHAWGPDGGRASNTMVVMLSRLRHKLLRPDGTSRIRTIRKVGYVFDTRPTD